MGSVAALAVTWEIRERIGTSCTFMTLYYCSTQIGFLGLWCRRIWKTSMQGVVLALCMLITDAALRTKAY